jgi:hypothetical protein
MEQWKGLQVLSKVTHLSASNLIRSAIDETLHSNRKKSSLENILSSSFGIWKDKNIKDSVGYVDELRKDWQKRGDRLRS